MKTISISKVKEQPQQHQVFINFCGKDVRLGFLSYLVWELRSRNINVFIDTDETGGQPLEVLLERIEESKIALVIFSENYTESILCLKELEKIQDCSDEGTLVAIPIFYKLKQRTVRNLEGEFGDRFRRLAKGDERKKWKDVIQSICDIVGIVIYRESIEGEKVIDIVEAVTRLLNEISAEGSQMATVSNISSESESIVEEIKETIKETTSKDSQKASENIITSNDKNFEIKQNLKIGFLLLLMFFCVQIASMALLIYDRMEKLKDKEIKFVDSFENSLIHDAKVKPPNIQVFINFRGAELRQSFISYLVDALQKSEINVFIDEEEQRGKDLNNLFKRIEGSGIAIVVFSSRYTQSRWCLDELVKIKERVHKGLLKVLPIYYKVTITNVKRLKGDFGDHFRDQEYMYQSDQAKIKQWKEAIEFVSHKFALSFHETSNIVEADFVRAVVKEVLIMLQDI